VLPGSTYGPRCVRRLQDDHAGFTLYFPFLVADGERIVYARDLHARDSALLSRYPSRSVYLVRPPSDSDGALPRFWPISRDSLRADEITKISRVVVVERTDPAVKAIASAMCIEHGIAEVANSTFFGLAIRHAFIITAELNPPPNKVFQRTAAGGRR